MLWQHNLWLLCFPLGYTDNFSDFCSQAQSASPQLQSKNLKWHPNKVEVIGDNSGNKIHYIYLKGSHLIIADNDKEFFEHLKQNFNLKIRRYALSQILLNNVVSYPNSIYEDVYFLSVCDKMTITCKPDEKSFFYIYDFNYDKYFNGNNLHI